jgi:hypothetical protein
MMSGNIDSVISESGGVKNVGVAFEIVSLSLSVQMLFLLPVYSPPFLNSGSWHPRRPGLMSRLSKPMISCLRHTQIHDVPVKNSGT